MNLGPMLCETLDEEWQDEKPTANLPPTEWNLFCFNTKNNKKLSVNQYLSALQQTQSQIYCSASKCPLSTPQRGAADAEIKVPSVENTELKGSPFKAWSRSAYSHTCYAYCWGFLPCLFLPFQSIHLHFLPKPLPIFPVLAVANTWFLCSMIPLESCKIK